MQCKTIAYNSFQANTIDGVSGDTDNLTFGRTIIISC